MIFRSLCQGGNGSGSVCVCVCVFVFVCASRPLFPRVLEFWNLFRRLCFILFVSEVVCVLCISEIAQYKGVCVCVCACVCVCGCAARPLFLRVRIFCRLFRIGSEVVL